METLSLWSFLGVNQALVLVPPNNQILRTGQLYKAIQNRLAKTSTHQKAWEESFGDAVLAATPGVIVVLVDHKDLEVLQKKEGSVVPTDQILETKSTAKTSASSGGRRKCTFSWRNIRFSRSSLMEPKPYRAI